MKILLTGATGIIGSTLATHLLNVKHPDNSPAFDIKFIVRGDSIEHSVLKLNNAILPHLSAHTETNQNLIINRIIPENVICGDMSTLDFLNDSKLEQTDVVVNLAASTSFNPNDEQIKLNTDRVVDFAKGMLIINPHLQKFIHTSAAYACGDQFPPYSIISNDWDTTNPTTDFAVYEKVKRQSENAIKAVPNLPFIIARPSIVVGHTQLGCSISSSLYWVLQAINQLEVFPCNKDCLIDVIAVDQVAKMFTALILRGEVRKSYNLSAYKSANTLFEIVESIGGNKVTQYKQVSTEVLKEMVQQHRGTDLYRVYKAVVTYSAFINSSYTFDNTSILQLCNETKTTPLLEYSNICLKTNEGKSLYELALPDFKELY